MKVNDLPSIKRLKEMFWYEPINGLFFHRQYRHRGISFLRSEKAGIEAGFRAGSGYISIFLDQKKYCAHRLAWLYVHGTSPKYNIDHIDGNRSNNAIANLRDVPQYVNCQNRRLPCPGNSTGLLGVQRYGKRFRVRIDTAGHCKHIGVFDTPDAAYAAYLAAKRELHEGCTI